jgi:undecaprenyl-diphosphatase
VAGVAPLKPSSQPPKPAPPPVRWRRIVLVLVLAAAVYFGVTNVALAGATVRSLGTFQWWWLVPIAGAAALTYALAAVAITAAAGRALPFRRTLAAQLAAAFTNRLAPAGLGAMATNVRYLEGAGLTRPAAMASVGLNSAAGFAVHAIATVAAFALVGARHQRFGVHAPDVPDRWQFLVWFALVLSVAGLVLGAVKLHGRWIGPARQALSQMVALGRAPRQGARLLGASLGITAAYALALAAAVQATGGGPTLVSVVAIYLGSSAVAAAAPTPGGLGALEAGLVAGLTSAGQAPAAALTAVLVYRVVTYWVPVLPGAAAFFTLRRAGTL